MSYDDLSSFGSSDSDSDGEVLRQRRSVIAERLKRRSNETATRRSLTYADQLEEPRRASDSDVKAPQKFISNDSLVSTRYSSATPDEDTRHSSPTPDARRSTKFVQEGWDGGEVGATGSKLNCKRRESEHGNVILFKKFQRDCQEFEKAKCLRARLLLALDDLDQALKETIQATFQETLTVCLSAAWQKICDARSDARELQQKSKDTEERFRKKEAQAEEQERRCKKMQTNYMKEVVILRDRLNHRRAEITIEESNEEISFWEPLNDLDPATRDLVMTCVEDKIKSAESKTIAIQQELKVAEEKIYEQSIQIAELREEINKANQALLDAHDLQGLVGAEDSDGSTEGRPEIVNKRSSGGKSLNVPKALAQSGSQRCLSKAGSRRSSNIVAPSRRSSKEERPLRKAQTCNADQLRDVPQAMDSKDNFRELLQDLAMDNSLELTDQAPLQRRPGKSKTCEVERQPSQKQLNNVNYEIPSLSLACEMVVNARPKDDTKDIQNADNITHVKDDVDIVSKQDGKVAGAAARRLPVTQSACPTQLAQRPSSTEGSAHVRPKDQIYFGTHELKQTVEQGIGVQECCEPEDRPDSVRSARFSAGSTEEALQASESRQPSRRSRSTDSEAETNQSQSEATGAIIESPTKTVASESEDPQHDSVNFETSQAEVMYYQAAPALHSARGKRYTRAAELPMICTRPRQKRQTCPVDLTRVLSPEGQESQISESKQGTPLASVSAQESQLAPLKRPLGKHRTFHGTTNLARNFEFDITPLQSPAKETGVRTVLSSGLQTDEVQAESSHDDAGNAHLTAQGQTILSAVPLELSLPAASPSRKAATGGATSSLRGPIRRQGTRSSAAAVSSFDPCGAVDASCLGTLSTDASAFGPRSSVESPRALAPAAEATSPGLKSSRSSVKMFGQCSSLESQSCALGAGSLEVAAFGPNASVESWKCSPTESMDLTVFGHRSSMETQTNSRPIESMKPSAKGNPASASSGATKHGTSFFRWLRPS